MANEIYKACQNGKLEEVKKLIHDNPTLLNHPHPVDKTYPIYFAAQKGHLEVIQYLLSKGAKTSHDPHLIGNLLFWVCRGSDNVKKGKMLAYIAQNFKDCRFEDGTTPLHIAAAKGDLEDVEYFKQHTADLFIPNQAGVTPYYYALWMGHQSILGSEEDQTSDIERMFNSSSVAQQDENYFANIFYLVNRLLLKDKLIVTRKIVETTLVALKALPESQRKDNDINTCYSFFRTLAHWFQGHGMKEYGKKEFLQSADYHEKAIETIKEIPDSQKNGDDRNSLDLYHSTLALATYCQSFSECEKKDYYRATSLVEKAIEILKLLDSNKLNVRGDLDTYYRNLTYVCGQHYSEMVNKESEEAIIIVEKVIDAYKKIDKKTDFDEKRLVDYQRPLTAIYTECGDKCFNTNNYTGAVVKYEKAREVINQIKDKNDMDYDNYSKISYKLGNLYSAYPIPPSISKNPIGYFREALHALNQRQCYTADQYQVISNIYRHWQKCCLETSAERNLTVLGQKVFRVDVNENFEEIFHPVYLQVLYSQGLSETTKLLGPMIQLMELLLRCSDKYVRSNNNINQLPLGMRYLLASEANRNLFHDKLVHLKASFSISLQNIVEQHPSTMFALLGKLKEMEAQLQLVVSENRALRSQLVQRESQSTIPALSRHPDDELMLPTARSSQPEPESAVAIVTEAKTPTPEPPAAASSSASTERKRGNDESQRWAKKTKGFRDDSPVVAPRSNLADGDLSANEDPTAGSRFSTPR